MYQLKKWVKMPNKWIENDGLCDFKWGANGKGSDNVSALMTLAVILHHMNEETGECKITYDHLCATTSLSRAKLANGLTVLEEHSLIKRNLNGRSSYQVTDYDPDEGWAKFPAKGLYRNGQIAAFSVFRLRVPAELNALKLYYLFASRRDRKTNLAKISYERISEMSGINQSHIKGGLTTLAVNGLIHVEHLPSEISDYGVANAYRLTHLDTYKHMGTSGRKMINS